MPGSQASACIAPSASEVAVVRVGRPGQHQLYRQTPGAQTAHRGGGLQHPFAAQHAGDQRDPDDRPGRLRQRREMRRVHPGAADQHEPRRIDPEPGQRLAVLRVLHDDLAAPTARRSAQPSAGRIQRPPPLAEPSPEPSPATAEMHLRPKAAARESQPHRQPAEQHRLQRDMMDDVRPLAAIECGDRGDCAGGADGTVAAPSPRQRRQAKSLAFDPRRVVPHPGRDDDIEPGVARRPRHGQPVRPEIPILGDQEDQPGPRQPLQPRCRGGGPGVTFLQRCLLAASHPIDPRKPSRVLRPRALLATGFCGKASRWHRRKPGLGAHSGDRGGRVHRPRPVPRAGRARPSGHRRGAPGSGRTRAGIRPLRASGIGRYRAGSHLGRRIARCRYRGSSGAAGTSARFELGSGRRTASGCGPAASRGAGRRRALHLSQLDQGDR